MPKEEPILPIDPLPLPTTTNALVRFLFPLALVTETFLTWCEKKTKNKMRIQIRTEIP